MRRPNGIHGYVCECPGPCSERVYLTDAAYWRLREMGNVVSRWCQSPQPRVVLFVDENAVVTRGHA